MANHGPHSLPSHDEQARLSAAELWDAWPLLSLEDRVEGFELLSRAEAEELFAGLTARNQMELLLALPSKDGDERARIRLNKEKTQQRK